METITQPGKVLSTPGQEGKLFLQPGKVKEFKINIPDKKINEIISKLRGAKLPKQMPPPPGESNWQTGADINWLEGLGSIGLTNMTGVKKKLI